VILLILLITINCCEWDSVFISLTSVTQQRNGNSLNKWTDLLFEEFFLQGDEERSKGMTITDLMDRATINVAKAQLGFIDVIVQPLYENFSRFMKVVEK
jgi:hypothetical protein